MPALTAFRIPPQDLTNTRAQAKAQAEDLKQQLAASEGRYAAEKDRAEALDHQMTALKTAYHQLEAKAASLEQALNETKQVNILACRRLHNSS